MRGLGSGGRDCHCGDCWLPKNVRDGRMGSGSVAAVDTAAAEGGVVVLASERYFQGCRRTGP